jgi:PAS domain S-box-containing protein
MLSLPILDLAERLSLLALIVVFYSVIRKSGTSLPRAVQQGLLGLAFGATALLSMLFPLPVAHGVIVDGRAVMLGLAGLFGGPIAAGVAAAIAAAYRIWLGGAGALGGVVSVAGSALMGVAVASLARRSGGARVRDLVILGLALAPANIAGFMLVPAPVALELVVNIAPALAVVELIGTVFFGWLLLQEQRRFAAEARLAESEARFRYIADHVPGAVYQRRMTPSGQISYPYFSQGIEAVIGITAEAAVADPVAVLKVIHPEDYDGVVRSLKESAEHLTPWSCSCRIVDRHGRTKWSQVKGSPRRDANGDVIWENILIDVTEQKLAEAALRESEARYRLLADHSTDVITRRDLSGKLLYVSPSSRQVLGYEPEELVGASLLEFVHPDDRECVRAALQVAPGPEPHLLTLRLRRKAGDFVWVEVARRLVLDPETGVPREVVSTTRDIGSRKAVEEELALAKETAERASRAKSEFLANLGHELRTPLNAVIGFSDLMLNESFGPLGHPRYRDYAADVRASGEHLLELINDILDHAKAEAGCLALHEDDVDLAAIFDFALHMLTPRAERAGLALVSTLAQAIRLRVDEKRLKQVLVNLVTNAIKYTPSGGSVTLSARVELAGDLMIEVEDTGIGIDERDLGTVLVPFGQVDHQRNREGEGTGLGLPLTKRLVELHGGTLDLRSLRGLGTTVSIHLPATRLITPPASAMATGARPRFVVLVVEDDAAVLKTAVERAESLGCRTIAARNANEALARLREERRVDMLFTDIAMPPGMSGTELASHAKLLHPEIQIRLTSGFGGPAVADDAAVSDGCRMISKPYMRRELEEHMTALLGPFGAPNVALFPAARALKTDQG